VIAVGAGKGGVGKSTVAVNLAISLAQEGAKVGLLDADIYGPSAAIMTGTSEHKAQGDAHQRVVPAVKHGIRIISMAFLLPKDQSAVVWRGPMVGKMVSQLLTGVAWGELDYLVVDLPPGTGDAVLSLSQSVPLSGAVVVTTPQDVSLIDARKGLAMFQKVNVPVLGIVENMSYYVCPKCGHREEIFKHGGGRRTAEKLGVPFLGEIPLDPKVVVGGDAGVPIVAAEPKSAVTEAYLRIADAVVRQLAP
jgi:ATP-binding protein involved in chromosome partitioning